VSASTPSFCRTLNELSLKKKEPWVAQLVWRLAAVWMVRDVNPYSGNIFSLKNCPSRSEPNRPPIQRAPLFFSWCKAPGLRC